MVESNPLEVSYRDFREITGHHQMELKRNLLKDPEVQKLIRHFFNNLQVYWILICGSNTGVAFYANTKSDIPPIEQINAFAENIGKAPFSFYRTDSMLCEILK